MKGRGLQFSWSQIGHELDNIGEALFKTKTPWYNFGTGHWRFDTNSTQTFMTDF